MSVSDIKEFFNEQSSLQELLEKNISDLQEKMKELEGAIKVCKTMQEKNEDIGSFDENFYWNEIRTEEKSGKKFLDIVGDVVQDVVQCEKSVLKNMGFVTRRGKMKYSKKGNDRRLVWLVFVDGMLEMHFGYLEYGCILEWI